jgi:hypothetical protein
MRPPRPPLQPPAVALEPRATVKLQRDVDIDLGQQRNLAPPREGRSFSRVARGASVAMTSRRL